LRCCGQCAQMGPKSMQKNDEKGLHKGKKRPPVREAGTFISNM